jgi:hypothetical protein
LGVIGAVVEAEFLFDLLSGVVASGSEPPAWRTPSWLFEKSYLTAAIAG